MAAGIAAAFRRLGRRAGRKHASAVAGHLAQALHSSIVSNGA